MQYLQGQGPMSSALAEGFAFFRSPFALYPDPNWPDVELLQLFINPGDDATPAAMKYFRINNETMEQYFKPLYHKRAFMFLSVLLHSTTKGSLRLKSTNPFDHPEFRYQYFDDDRDLEALVYAMKTAVKITSQKPFRDLGVKLYQNKLPGCKHLTFNSHEYWRCHAMTLTYVGYHFVSSFETLQQLPIKTHLISTNRSAPVRWDLELTGRLSWITVCGFTGCESYALRTSESSRKLRPDILRRTRT